MNGKVLLFPLCTAAVAALDGCTGPSITDLSVRRCHDDTVDMLVVVPSGETTQVRVVYHDDTTRCRPVKKAA